MSFRRQTINTKMIYIRAVYVITISVF